MIIFRGIWTSLYFKVYTSTVFERLSAVDLIILHNPGEAVYRSP